MVSSYPGRAPTRTEAAHPTPRLGPSSGSCAHHAPGQALAQSRRRYERGFCRETDFGASSRQASLLIQSLSRDRNGCPPSAETARTAGPRRRLGLRARGRRKRRRFDLLRSRPLQRPDEGPELHRGGPSRIDGVPAPTRRPRLCHLQHTGVHRRAGRRRGLPPLGYLGGRRCRHRSGRRYLPTNPQNLAGFSDPRIDAAHRH